ncbi:unnamed protein product, partial [Brenthis ino]
MWGISCLLLLTLGLVQGTTGLDPLVDTPQGLIRGLRADEGDYSMFLGIPYAKVDENNPFGASSPHPKFDNVFEAYDDSAVCPQKEELSTTIIGTLDCLNLNVFVPNKASSKNKLPVVVWIHGGRFRYGSGNRDLYSPNFLIRHDVILVTLNYRLGPYGFMCLNTPDVPGNQGLKDQYLGMRWVKDNIAAFGGDANKITIMGESAGAMSIDFHLISKREKLFNQAIIESGSVFHPTVIEDADTSKPLKIAEHLGFHTDDLSQALAFLKETDVKLVIAATEELGLTFYICVEEEFEDVESMLLDHPINMDYPNAKRIPILSGFNSHEQSYIFGNKNADYFKNLNIFRELDAVFNYDEDFQEMEDLMRHFYIGDEDITDAVRHSIIDFISDYDFNFPGQKSIQKYLESGAQDVYQYLFAYSGERNYLKNRENVTIQGAAHADELGYLFDLPIYKEQPSEADQRIIDQITTLWTNFAKYGALIKETLFFREPTPEVSDLLPVQWVPTTKDINNYLLIDTELKMEKRPYSQRLAFWELFYKVNENKIKGKRND